MSRKQVITCDRCSKFADDDNPESIKALALSTVTVGRRIAYTSYSGNQVYPASKEWTCEWCAACCREVGVFEILALEEKPPQGQAIPTLEDMIREIVRQEMP